MNVDPESFDHYSPELANDPYPTLRAMREECPVAHSREHGGFWALTRYRDVYDAVHDVETFSSALGAITIPAPMTLDGDDGRRPVPISYDPPEHRRFRAFINPYFSPARVESMEPWFRRIARDLIDRFADRGTADFAREFAIPMPMIVICGLLGIPDERWEEFRDQIEDIIAFTDKDRTMNAILEVGSYLARMLAQRREVPTDDLLSFVANGVIDGEPMSEREILGFAILLFGAGAETTTNAVGNTLAYLAEHAELRRELAAHPDLLPNAIEEFLRFDTPVFGLARTLTKDTTFGGQDMSADDRVLLLWGAANHDPEEFHDPDRVDIHRLPNRHLAFGAGIHRCLGSHLARLELRVALEELLARIPEFALAPDARPERCVGITRGTRSLPVVFPA